MTRDNWLTAAAIITAIMMAVATLMAPSLAEFVKFRLSQPTKTPALNTVSALAARRGKWMFRGALGVIALSIIALVFEAVFSAPLTRWGVIRIVAWFFFIAMGHMGITLVQILEVLALVTARLNLQGERLTMVEDNQPSPDNSK